MGDLEGGRFATWSQRARGHWAESQHRNAYYLLFNNVLGAAAGLVFWILITRVARVPTEDVGVGYAVVALGTLVGLLAKGGLDTALIRSVPQASSQDSGRLLRLSYGVGCGAAVFLTLVLAAASLVGGAWAGVSYLGWILVALIGVFLVITWLQDARFLAEGEAKLSFVRNVAFSATRLALPLLIVIVAWPQPVAVSWMLALLFAAATGAVLARRLPARDGAPVARRAFMGTALRNASGSAAEFLPGLLLTPLVLAMEGPAAAAYFGIAWTAASLLFLASSSIGRSALAEMARTHEGGEALAIRRATLQHVWIVAPAAAGLALLAPFVLNIFGPDYAERAALTLMILCASLLVVAPAYLWLAVLRARDRPIALAAFPAAMMGALAILGPALADRFGLNGFALAWAVANAPFGAYAAWKLFRLTRGVISHGAFERVRRPAYVQ